MKCKCGKLTRQSHFDYCKACEIEEEKQLVDDIISANNRLIDNMNNKEVKIKDPVYFEPGFIAHGLDLRQERRIFAALNMHSLLSKDTGLKSDLLAKISIAYADELIRQLNESEKK